MAVEVKLSPLGEESPEEAEVSFWYVAEGDHVEEGQDLVELVTDKAAFTVPSPAAGTLTSIVVPEGAKVQVEGVMAVIE